MRAKFTLHRADGSAEDVEVTADATALVGDVADTVLRCDPARPVAAGPVTLAMAHRDGGYLPLDRARPLADSGLRSGAAIALVPVSERHAGAAGYGRPAGTLTVLSGPDAGLSVEIGASCVIGRSPDCDVRLTDTLVSKRHARVGVGEVVELVDLNSANGILIAGSLTRKAVLGSTDVAVLGNTAIQVVPYRSTGPVDSLTVPFNRSPQVRAEPAGPVLTAPEPPAAVEPQRFPMIGLLAPLLFAGILFGITRNPVSIVFAALSPVLMAGQWLEGRISAARGHAAAVARFRDRLVELRSELGERAAEEVRQRQEEHVSTAAVLTAALARGPLLWSRRPRDRGYLQLRLGLGWQPALLSLELPRTGSADPDLFRELADLAEDHRQVGPVPVVADLTACGSLGVAGPEAVAQPVARSLVAQLAGLHSPAELVVLAVTDGAGAGRWGWLRWLPHTSSGQSPVSGPHLAADPVSATTLIAELEELVAARTDQDRGADGREGPDLLLLVEDGAPVDRARLVWLAEHGPAAGLHVLWQASSVDRLPAACRCFLSVAPSGEGTVGLTEEGSLVTPVAPEPLNEQDAERFARALAPVVDDGARSDDLTDLPRSVSLLALSGTALGQEPREVVERWTQSGSLPVPGRSGTARDSLSALVGQAGAEPFYLDLRRHGPHALVGGTTGSGKSEFLQSWVLGLATTYSPQRVTFLFVDYKGGSAFGECAMLPHSVGMITDLTPNRFKRTLVSLRAELRHREHLLSRKKAKDLQELERRGDPETPPSLVIVVDEFAALVQDVPEFVDGMVDVAQRGRSLGLHLVLATQRPAGVIKDNLRANTNLRIALRMADEADSSDVLGAPVAAAIEPGLAGRGFAKTGPGRLTTFQTGYVGGWTSDRPPPPAIAVARLGFGAAARWEEPEDRAMAESPTGPTDMHRMVQVIEQAAQGLQLPSPRRPWLPTLAATYRLDHVPTGRTDTELVFGVQDDPEEQRQAPIAFRPDEDGNLAVFGTGGSGKSTFLRSLGVAAGLTSRGGPCLVYGLDFGTRGLAMLEELPHVGSVIPGEDRERLGRLLRRLRGVIDDRAERYARANAATVTEYRERAGCPEEPRLLLLVDAVGAFRQAHDSRGSGLWELFLSIAADGRPVGVHVVVSADRAVAVPGALASVIQQRVLLRPAAPDEYLGFGVPADAFAADAPPGRALVDGREVQVAVLGGSTSVAQQARAFGELARSMAKAGALPAPRIESLTSRIELGRLPVEVGGLPVVGVADETLEPFGLEPFSTFLVAGPPGSGRTTALATVALATVRAKRFLRAVYLGPGRGPLAGLPLWTYQASGDERIAETARALVADLSSGNAEPTLVVVESVAEYAGGSVADQPLQALAKACAVHGHGLVAEGETSTLTAGFGPGLLSLLKNARCGLLLQPEGSEEPLYRTPVPRLPRAELPPGRGLVISGGKTTQLQVALPEEG